MKGGQKLARKALVLLVSLAAAGLAAEIALRAWLQAEGRPHSAWRTRDRLRTVRLWADRNLAFADEDRRLEDVTKDPHDVLSPYLGFDHESALDGYARMRPYFASQRGERAFDVLVLGGSVAAQTAQFSGAALEEALREDPRLAGREVRIHLQARGGYKQIQQLVLAAILFDLGWKPDLVIEIDGFNETAIGNQNRVWRSHPMYPGVFQWGHLLRGPTASESSIARMGEMVKLRWAALRVATEALELRLYYSALASRAVFARLDSLRRRHGESARRFTREDRSDDADAVLRGPGPPPDLAATIDAIALSWSEASVSLDAMCRARGIPFVHVLQPTLHDAGSKPTTEEERRTGTTTPEWLDGVRAGYPRLREEGARLRERGVAFFDASRLFEGVAETLYYDACHFGQKGTDALARFAAEKALGVME